MLPGILFGPFIGSLVDRLNRKYVIIAAGIVYGLSAATLFALAELQLLALWHVYVVMFCNALAGQFHYLAVSAATAVLVPGEHLQRISGVSQLREGAVSLMAPPVGALLLESIHLDGILFLEICTSILAIVFVLATRLPQPAPPDDAGEAPESIFASVKSGFSYIVAWPGMLALMGMAMVLNLFFNPAFSLMPLLVKNHFLGDVKALALMETVFGAGMIAGSLLLGAWGGFSRKTDTMLVGVAGMGVAILVLGVTPSNWFYVGLACMAVIGLTQPLTNGPLMAIIQGNVDIALQGRVMGFLGTAAGIISPIGLLMAGPVADTYGVQIWYVVAGVVSVLAVPVGLLLPSFRGLDTPRLHSPAGDEPSALP
jgi:DHA3 family macrolide efflux protein-like MFS transporter